METRSITPGVSILLNQPGALVGQAEEYSHLTFELFHDVEKAIVNFGLSHELDLISVYADENHTRRDERVIALSPGNAGLALRGKERAKKAISSNNRRAS